jgi:arsenite-transporting ATPase
VRVLLFTGKGGVGKTTIAAATAAVGARLGQKTLVLSTDHAHSLADALRVDASGEPSECAPGLFVQQVDTEARLTQSWGEIQRYLLTVLDSSGFDRLRAEELTVLPGAEEVFALLEVRDQVRSGRWDLVVVDCAPTSETLRLLALPEALDWYLSKLYPIERKVVRALRPVLSNAVGLPLPHQSVVESAEQLQSQLRDVQDVLQSPTTSVRLVLTPESVVVAEARRMLTSLALYGYRVDAVVANRVFPDGSDPWRAGWVAAQQAQLSDVSDSFSPLPIFLAPYQAGEPMGEADLADLAGSMYGGSDPFALPEIHELLVVEREADAYVISLALPLAQRHDVDLARVGDDLVLAVGGRRRVLALPSALRRCRVDGAKLLDGRLRIRFVPDAAQWSREGRAEGGAHP